MQSLFEAISFGHRPVQAEKRAVVVHDPLHELIPECSGVTEVNRFLGGGTFSEGVMNFNPKFAIHLASGVTGTKQLFTKTAF